jgi:hypothetical protein
MGLRFSFPIELRIDLASLPQGWKEEVVVNETLKDSLMKSPLTDKIFDLSLQKVQEEVSKAPQFVSGQKDNVLPKQVPVTNYEVNSPTLTK